MLYLIIIFIAVALMLSCRAKAETGMTGKTQLGAKGGEKKPVRFIDLGYENCRYLSLKDTAAALDTFDVKVKDGEISITTGVNFAGEPAQQTESEITGLRPVMLKTSLDGKTVKYYGIKFDDDAYLMPFDIALMLGFDIKADLGAYECDLSRPLTVDIEKMEEYGYFEGVNAALVGDADTGEVLYAYNADRAFAIASTTKLMTYLLTKDSGLKAEDEIVICREAAELSRGDDATTPLTEGARISAWEMWRALLLPSSNECALALAVHVAGSEEKFAELMNAKAKELGMNSARFYNASGLPQYTKTAIIAKRQNRVSAEDMFKLARHILKTYPEVKEITSTKTAVLPAMGMTVNNTNFLLHNMPEVTGLKTGTTNKAGCCLITSLYAGGHEMVTVMLGAESSPDRVRTSQLLCRYALCARHK